MGFTLQRITEKNANVPHLSCESELHDGMNIELESYHQHISGLKHTSQLSLSNDKSIKIQIINNIRYFIKFNTVRLTIYQTNTYILYSLAII